MGSEKILNWAKVIYYCLAGLFFLVLGWYIFNIDSIVERESQAIVEVLDKVQCRIEFKEFSYSGLCLKQEMAFQFLSAYYNVSMGG